MMKKLLLAIALAILSSSSALAVCPQIPLNVKDASSNTVPMSSATAADGNCKTYVDADTASNLNTLLTNPPNVTVNGSNAALTGLTPGGAAQTGTVIALNMDWSSVKGAVALTGTGAQGAGSPRVTVATDQATNAGAALVKGGVGVVNGASTYATIAASQTAQVLGATGAAGDYLSHCVIQPTTTAAGTVTILDNATTIFTFTTGTLSNLVPFSIPVGAVSTSGAWKVTTGANETVTCVGKFT